MIEDILNTLPGPTNFEVVLGTSPIEAFWLPDMDDGGVVRGFYALVMDVTERNLAQHESTRLQDELLHSSRITTMGELAGALAHEINQPLSAIMSNAQAAKRFIDLTTPDLEEGKDILDDIVAEDARAGEVINFSPPSLRAWAWAGPSASRPSVATKAASGSRTTPARGPHSISACRRHVMRRFPDEHEKPISHRVRGR